MAQDAYADTTAQAYHINTTATHVQFDNQLMEH